MDRVLGAGGMGGEHVARAIAVGVLETGAPFMVMCLDGHDLSELIRGSGAMPALRQR